MNKLLAFVAALAGVALVASGCSVAPYAAVVNGTRIPQSDLTFEINAIKHNSQYRQALEQQGQLTVGGTGINDSTFDASFASGVLRRQILLAVVHQEVVRLHLAEGPDVMAQAQQSVTGNDTSGMFKAFPKRYLDILVQRAADVDVLSHAVTTTRTDAPSVQQYFSQHQQDYTTTCVRHILVTDQALATSLRAQLAAGADFATLAKANSKDTGSAAQGGSLGCLTPAQASQLVPEFTNAMNGLAVNQLSQPVYSAQYGYFIIQVTGRPAQSLQDATSAIQSTLQSQQSNEFTQYVLKALTTIRVSVNPRYGSFDPTSAQLTPPKAPAVSLPTNTPTTAAPLTNPLGGSQAGSPSATP